MNKEEIPIEYYLTKNGEVIKFVRYDELDKYKQVIDKIKKHINETIKFEKECGFNYWNYDGGQEEYIEMVKKTLELLEEIDV